MNRYSFEFKKMNNLIDGVNSFAANLGIDSEYFKLHHGLRKQPTRLDQNTDTQADITFHTFYRK